MSGTGLFPAQRTHYTMQTRKKSRMGRANRTPPMPHPQPTAPATHAHSQHHSVYLFKHGALNCICKCSIIMGDAHKKKCDSVTELSGYPSQQITLEKSSQSSIRLTQSLYVAGRVPGRCVSLVGKEQIIKNTFSFHCALFKSAGNILNHDIPTCKRVFIPRFHVFTFFLAKMATPQIRRVLSTDCAPFSALLPEQAA